MNDSFVVCSAVVKCNSKGEYVLQFDKQDDPRIIDAVVRILNTKKARYDKKEDKLVFEKVSEGSK